MDPTGIPTAAPDTEPPTPAARPQGFELLAWTALVAMKATIFAVAVDALLRHDQPPYRGKAMQTRALGYVGASLLVPLAWRLLPHSGRYPRGLDLAISTPLLLDAVGNAGGIYQKRHIDDLVHLANGAIVAGVAGSVVAPHVDERWQAALAGAGIGITGQTLWELMEYLAYRFGARGMDLTYEDTMDDMIESTIGALIGGAFTLTRVPRAKAERRTGWRSVVGG